MVEHTCRAEHVIIEWNCPIAASPVGVMMLSYPHGLHLGGPIPILSLLDAFSRGAFAPEKATCETMNMNCAQAGSYAKRFILKQHHKRFLPTQHQRWYERQIETTGTRANL